MLYETKPSTMTGDKYDTWLKMAWLAFCLSASRELIQNYGLNNVHNKHLLMGFWVAVNGAVYLNSQSVTMSHNVSQRGMDSDQTKSLQALCHSKWVGG